MNALAEAKIRDYLREMLHYDPYQAGTIVYRMRELARAAGHELDERFARANLGAGPEARVACTIVALALGAGGGESSMYAVRKQIDEWLRRTPAKGMIA
jgi:hypothetical protein